MTNLRWQDYTALYAGRHAIAFVGRRHFDDADLLDRLFEPAKEH